MLTPDRIKNRLNNSFLLAHSNMCEFVLNPEKDFSRKSKCDFFTTLKAIFSFRNHTLPNEMLQFFDYAKDTPTASALIQQRAKFNDKIFPFLFNTFNEKIPFVKTYNGYHLIAGDGTDINLPTLYSDLEYFMEFQSKARRGYWQMHANALFDVEESRYLDVLLQPRPVMNEAAALCAMVDRCSLGKNTLFILDRLYPCYNVLAHIQHKEMYYLIRAKSPDSTGSFLKKIDLPDTDEYDVDISLTLTRSGKKEYRRNPSKYRILHTKRTFDFIAPNDRISTFQLNFRVIKIKLSDGNYEHLISNLPRNDFDLRKLKKLYSERWKIETSFRHLKYSLGMVHFHSKKRNFIIQEIYAHLIMYNFTSLLAACANNHLQKKKGWKWNYKVSFANAVSVAKRFLKEKMSEEDILNVGAILE